MFDENYIYRILKELEITAELRDWEIIELARGVTVQEHKAGTYMCSPNKTSFGDSLAILASGEAEVNLLQDNKIEHLGLLKTGDIAGVITFIGGNVSEISASVLALSDCVVLLLSREYMEKLQARHPVIVYLVMRAVVRQLHGVARHMNVHAMEIQNYIYRTNTRG